MCFSSYYVIALADSNRDFLRHLLTKFTFVVPVIFAFRCVFLIDLFPLLLHFGHSFHSNFEVPNYSLNAFVAHLVVRNISLEGN
jgi:hypothetical protein